MLYENFPEVRGLAQNGEDFEVFLATFILALSQTKYERARQVILFAPRHHNVWIFKLIKEIFRYAVRCRRGDKANIEVLQTSFSQIAVDSRFLQTKEPDYWVSFGIVQDSLIPPWLGTKLSDDI